MRNNRSWFIQASINLVTRTSALVIFDEEMVMEERDGGGVLLFERFLYISIRKNGVLL